MILNWIRENITKFGQVKGWVKFILIILAVNIGIFSTKVCMFGLKGYYILQLTISIALFNLIYSFYVSSTSTFSLPTKLLFFHISFFNSLGLNNYINLSNFCLGKTKRVWTWIFTWFCFTHLISISVITMLTWNCTMYVRITAAAAFFGWISGLIALKLQARSIKIDAERLQTKLNKTLNATSSNNDNIQEQPNKMLLIAVSEQHPYHIVPTSIWPSLTAFLVYDILYIAVRYSHYGLSSFLKHHLQFLILFLAFVLTAWFWNIIQEANEGHQTSNVRWNLLHGFILFIASEVMLFFAIFWCFFHSSLSPSVLIGCIWPPLGIHTIDPFGLPFFNTILLLSSGISLTVSHRALVEDEENPDFERLSNGLIATLVLGGFFSIVQLFEYIHAPFSINDSIYGSIFFFSTGFHGAHVIIGSVMLAVNLVRNTLRHLHPKQHIGFLSAIWYWHFVDIIWVFLFVTIYWWGS